MSEQMMTNVVVQLTETFRQRLPDDPNVCGNVFNLWNVKDISSCFSYQPQEGAKTRRLKYTIDHENMYATQS